MKNSYYFGYINMRNLTNFEVFKIVYCSPRSRSNHLSFFSFLNYNEFNPFLCTCRSYYYPHLGFCFLFFFLKLKYVNFERCKKRAPRTSSSKTPHSLKIDLFYSQSIEPVIFISYAMFWI